MLGDADIVPILDALDDAFPAVRDAALRVVELLRPNLGTDAIIDPLNGIAETQDDGSSPLSKALEKLRENRSSGVPTGGVPSEVPDSAPRVLNTPDVLRATFDAATSVMGRLYPAIDLAALGSGESIERVLIEIESGPLNIQALRHVGSERPHVLPSDVATRLRTVAEDDNRRGDVRRLAWWLASGTVVVEEPPFGAELVDYAERVADAYLGLQDDASGIDSQFDVLEALKYLGPEGATLLVVALFEKSLGEAFESQGYAAGNFVVQVVASIGSRFVPDIPALAELYFEIFQHTQGPRADWYRLHDDYIVFSSGPLALGWQIAWTVSRAGILDVIAGVASFLESEHENERLAALALLEDAIRYLPYAYPPLFGGVSEPSTDTALIGQSVTDSSATSPTAEDGYTTVQVFFGTDRRPTGSKKPSQWFGSEHGHLTLGVCEVTVPSRHHIGEIESPSWYVLRSRLDPARYVVLQTIEQQSATVFEDGLRKALSASGERHAFVFVHGYRVSFENAARRTAQMAVDLEIQPALLYSWPSKERLLGYDADRELAEIAVPSLIKFLDFVADRSGAEVIYLIAHSMGCLALSMALREYVSRRRIKGPSVFREVILAAPDIDATIFKEQIVPKIAGKVARTTLYASRRDYALLASRWKRTGLSRAGFIEAGKPLVVAGVETIDVSAVNSEVAWGLLQGHSYWAERPEIVSDMYQLLRFNKGAGERFGHSKKVLDDGPYWIMKARKRG